MQFLEIREKEILETIKKLKGFDIVIIGGYAINVYTLPRFSVDCDIVVMTPEEATKIEEQLLKIGYEKREEGKIKTPYHGEFLRYEKTIVENFRVSIDIMIGNILDRQTGASLTAQWVFENSSFKMLKGKTIQEEVHIRIPSPEALIVMKLLSCRINDRRDIFMILPQVKDFEKIKREVSEKTNFLKQYTKLKYTITSAEFKNNLQGVFGSIPEKIFNRNKELVLKLGR